MPLDGPLLPADWTAELNYLANSDGSMTLSLTEGPETKVPVHPGLNRVFVRLSGRRRRDHGACADCHPVGMSGVRAGGVSGADVAPLAPTGPPVPK